MIANRLLEADEDFNVSGEIERLTSSPHPGIELESEGNHWNVYKKGTPPGFIGEIYYDDMTEAPFDVMTPEAREYWNTHRWIAIAGFRESETTPCASFDEALNFILAINAAKTARPVGESDDPDDPEMYVQKFAKERGVPVEMEVANNLGRQFRVRLVWDKPAGGHAYDAEGNEVQEKLQPTVEFYDMTHARNPDYQNSSIWKNGQFVSSYYAATLMERPTGGLDLMGYEPVWKIDARAMDKVRAWIKTEVEGRGYKLVGDEAGGISFGMRYEALDPDDPELYTHPERFSGQPSDEKIEGELRRMLAPYYTRVSINKRPGLFASRELIQRDVPGEPEGTEHRVPFKDSYVWTIHCNRDTPLPLPPTRPFVGHRGPDPNSWRNQVEGWFERWARESGLYMFSFEIYGRLRKDPTFQFQTARIGPLKESEDDDPSPEAMLAHYAATTEWTTDMYNDLWKFHSRGVGYEVLDLGRAAFVVARTYFPPDKDDFAQRLRSYVQSWFEQKRIFPVKFVKLYSFKHAQRTGGYDEWSTIAAVNIPWPDTGLAEYDLPEIKASSVEVGKSPLPDPSQA
jgi:hypothetical protein